MTDGVSNYRRLDCLLNRLIGRRLKKTSKLRVTGLCDGNSQVTGEFSAHEASNAENVSILMTSSWWIEMSNNCKVLGPVRNQRHFGPFWLKFFNFNPNMDK